MTVTRSGNNQPNVSVTTAANGTFTIPNTLGGTYKVTPNHGTDSFLPAFDNITVRGGDVDGGELPRLHRRRDDRDRPGRRRPSRSAV